MILELVSLLLLPVENPPEGVDESPHVPGVHLEDAPRPLRAQPSHVEAVGQLHHVKGRPPRALFGQGSTSDPAAANVRGVEAAEDHYRNVSGWAGLQYRGKTTSQVSMFPVF